MLWFIGVAVVLLLIPTSILFCQNQKLKELNGTLSGQVEISEKHLSQSLIRAKTERTDELSKLRDLASEQGTDIQKIENDLSSIGADLEAVAQTTAKTKTVVHNHYTSDSTSPSKTKVPICEEDGRPIDVHEYTKRTETVNIQDSNGMRLADVSFSAAEKAPWRSKVYGLTYKVNNTIGRSGDDRVILYTELLVSNPEAQPGEVFRIEGIESRVLQAPEPDPEFDWWDPSLYLMAQLGMEVYDHLEFSASLSIGFSVWSYGDNWRFLGVSAGYDAFRNAFRASLIPVLYNVGGPLPIINDLWVGFDVGISHQADVSVGIVIGTRL